MKYYKTTFLLLWTFLAAACSNPQSPAKKEQSSGQAVTDTAAAKTLHDGLRKAYFASGCFWCVEAIFESVKGVEEAVSGYAGGEEKNPTYESVSSGQSRHAEAVEVYYDPEKISYATLLEVFFGSHDPTTPNQQGPDKGPQYRSIVFYQSAQEKQMATGYIEKLEKAEKYERPIVTEVVPFEVFYKAEDYHQDYEEKHPDNPYVLSVSIPRLEKFKEKYPQLLK